MLRTDILVKVGRVCGPQREDLVGACRFLAQGAPSLECTVRAQADPVAYAWRVKYMTCVSLSTYRTEVPPAGSLPCTPPGRSHTPSCWKRGPRGPTWIPRPFAIERRAIGVRNSLLVLRAAGSQMPSSGREVQRASESRKKRDKRSWDYILRSGLAGGVAGCAVRRLTDAGQNSHCPAGPSQDSVPGGESRLPKI